MYSFLREQAKQNISSGEINFDILSDNISLEKNLDANGRWLQKSLYKSGHVQVL